MPANDQRWSWPATTVSPGLNWAGACVHGTPFSVRCWSCQPAASSHLAGWVCAGCGHGYAPSLTECPRCPVQSPAGARDGFEDAASRAIAETQRLAGERAVHEMVHGTLAGWPVCPAPREGGLCGCGEDGDSAVEGSCGH